MIMTTYQAAIQSETLRKGPWLEEEDERLSAFVTLLGERKWDSLARVSGLNRSGKSCRLRWLNYLRPNIKRGHISEEEEQIIIQLHERWGNRWSRIARRLPGRTDNEIKNYWRSHLKKKIQQAQEEGNLLCQVKNAKDDLLCQKADTTTWKFVLEDYTSLDPTVQHNDSALDNSDLSSFSHLNSPYESRLYDWMLELSSCQNETEIHGSCNGLSSCFCYFAWHSDDTDATTFDSWGSLWDMN